MIRHKSEWGKAETLPDPAWCQSITIELQKISVWHVFRHVQPSAFIRGQWSFIWSSCQTTSFKLSGCMLAAGFIFHHVLHIFSINRKESVLKHFIRILGCKILSLLTEHESIFYLRNSLNVWLSDPYMWTVIQHRVRLNHHLVHD